MYQRLESSSDKKTANATSNPPVINKVEKQSVSHSQDKLSMIDFNTKVDPTASEKSIKYQARQFFFSTHQKKTSVELKAELFPENVVPKSYGKTIIDDVQYKKYYKMFENKEEKRVIKLMRHHISRITFDQFLARLNQCMDLLEEQIDKNLYAKGPILLCNDKGHSQEWVNKLVAPRLKPLLGARLEEVEIAHPPQRQEKLVNQLLKQLHDTGEANHLYFDDCSYSGTQLSKYVQSILISLEMKHRTSKEKSLSEGARLNLILVVPYMTATAAQLIQETLEKNQDFLGSSFEINFKLISSGVISRIKDLPIEKHHKEIFLKCMDTKEDKTLTITDWKMPDFVSFPKFFMNGHTKQSFNEDTEPSPFLSQDEGFKPYGS